MAAAAGAGGLSPDEALAVLADPERPEAERIAAAERLGALGHTAAIDRMFAVRERCETYLARAIGAALRAMNAGPEVAKGLRSADPEARIRAAERLLRLDDPRMEASILEGLRDPEPRVRRALVQALARIESPSAAAAVDRALADRHPDVRAVAVAAVGARRDPAAAAKLRDLLERESDDVVRDFIERALGRAKG
jgi:HEAT repeat protein